MTSAEIGIIGGSGFYSFFSDAERVEVDTPFGAPSAPLTIGEVGGRNVAFLPRHGEHHQFPPHLVNYRANLWALRSVGVREVLGPCAVGSLQRDIQPGTFVVPDQVVDRTWGRPSTVYDQCQGAVHATFAEPYCPHGRAALLASESDDTPLTSRGTLVVINGPRFSTRAESRWHTSNGWSVVGMTGMPEASIARELQLCYSTVCCVTDMDAGIEGESGVSHEHVVEVFADNIERLKALLVRTITALPPAEDDCACRHGMDGQTLLIALP